MQLIPSKRHEDRQLLDITFDRLIGSDVRLSGQSREFVPRWDSLGHVSLILELEKKLKRSFSVHQIESMNSYKAILKVLDLEDEKL